MKVAILFSNGTEELEALTPLDILRRAGVDVQLVSVCGETPVGSHNIAVKCDKLITEINLLDYDGIIIPGGLPGAQIISDNGIVISALTSFIEQGKLVCSICASPALVLAKHGLINGRKATCYPAPDFIKLMSACKFSHKNVVVDKNLITANGPKSAFDFSLAICKYLGVSPKF